MLLPTFRSCCHIPLSFAEENGDTGQWDFFPSQHLIVMKTTVVLSVIHCPVQYACNIQKPVSGLVISNGIQQYICNSYIDENLGMVLAISNDIDSGPHILEGSYFPSL